MPRRLQMGVPTDDELVALADVVAAGLTSPASSLTSLRGPTAATAARPVRGGVPRRRYEAGPDIEPHEWMHLTTAGVQLLAAGLFPWATASPFNCPKGDIA